MPFADSSMFLLSFQKAYRYFQSKKDHDRSQKSKDAIMIK